MTSTRTANLPAKMQAGALSGFMDSSDEKMEMFVTVFVGGYLLGFPIAKVREIIYIEKIFHVPETPAEVAGLINIRGRIILVTDMRKWMFPQKSSTNAPSKEKEGGSNLDLCLILENDDEMEGLLVDDIGDILSLPISQACQVPAGLDPRWKKICTAVFPLEGRLMLGIDPASFLPELTSATAALVAAKKANAA